MPSTALAGAHTHTFTAPAGPRGPKGAPGPTGPPGRANDLDIRDFLPAGWVEGVTNSGPAFSAASTAANAAAQMVVRSVPQGWAHTLMQRTLYVPPLTYRMETSAIIKGCVRLDAYGATFLGPIIGAEPIFGPGTPPAGATDMAAQTAGACFIDDGTGTENSNDLARIEALGATFVGFRYGFVSLSYAWLRPLWKDVLFQNTNIGIFTYQAAQGPRIIDTFSGGGTTYVGGATCYPVGHPLSGMGQGLNGCDALVFRQDGRAYDISPDNPDFDAWFSASILRPLTPSVLTESHTYPFTGTALHVSGRNIYIPGRNRTLTALPRIENVISVGCPRGIALVYHPRDGVFRNLHGELMFNPAHGGPDAMVTTLIRDMGWEPGKATGSFENIDALFATYPGVAVAVVNDPNETWARAHFRDMGGLRGTPPITGYPDNFA